MENNNKPNMNKEQLRQAIIAILVGAVTAFLTSFFNGIADWLNGHGTEVVGGAVATAKYIAKSIS